jgi:hypothetical protein
VKPVQIWDHKKNISRDQAETEITREKLSVPKLKIVGNSSMILGELSYKSKHNPGEMTKKTVIFID